MTQHPVLIDLCKEKRDSIEFYPVSNEVWGRCGTVKNQPLPVLLARNMSRCVWFIVRDLMAEWPISQSVSQSSAEDIFRLTGLF
jgi:hypothetical protein